MVLGEGGGRFNLPCDEFKLFGQRRKTKRLLPEGRVRRNLRFRQILRVPGNIDDANIRSEFSNLLGQFGAAKAWHENVREKNVDGARMAAGQLNSIVGVVRFEDAMTGTAKEFDDRRAKGRFIIRDQVGVAVRRFRGEEQAETSVTEGACCAGK